ncbi:MAG: hypothetical protein IKZ97_07640, partial [Butyrivibrio sp.]|nr:hypothetical protein [Butyrivibrio sp.]
MIIIQLKGGLGNQMFQYALYRALKKKGKTVKIKINAPGAKVKWKTSNKSIAYVSSVKGKKGQIAVIKAGKKAGICKITATVGKK